MLTNYKYRLYCNDELDYVYTTNDTGIEPTICPNNPLHILDTNATCIIETIKVEKALPIILENNNINSLVFNRIGVCNFPGARLAESKIISFMDNTLTSYTIRLVDSTNSNILLETTLNNLTESMENLGSLANLPSSPVLLEIYAKKVGVLGSGYIKSLTIYYV